MKRWKQWCASVLVIAICFTSTSCEKRKIKYSRFGMDINELNPLVMTATDGSSGETVFSRDPQVISEVLEIFQDMEPSQTTTTNQTGISFTASTMYGNFAFGECTGKTLRLDGSEYTLKKDYSKKITLLYERMKSETESTASVSADIIEAVKPDDTYSDLLNAFGPTLVTAAVGEKTAYLYQYEDRPFYILFEKDTDTVGMTGNQLKEAIWNNYNLTQSLTAPDEPKGGRLAVYEQAFDEATDKQLNQNAFTAILLDTKKLVYLDDAERQELISHLQQKYSVSVEDDPSASEYASDDASISAVSGQLVLWIEQYTYIGNDRMDFVAAAKQDGQAAVTQPMEANLQDNEWSVQWNG